MSLIKNLVERINVQNDKGYRIERTKIKKPNQLQQKKTMIIDPNALSKAIKDGRKAGTLKCIFSYTEQEWPADAEKQKLKSQRRKDKSYLKMTTTN